jgi:hypothetical protein
MIGAISIFAAAAEDATPFRVLIAAPANGFDSQLRIMHAWLDRICGPSNWASAPAGLTGIVNDAIAFYFADAKIARAFIARFACGYRPMQTPIPTQLMREP